MNPSDVRQLEERLLILAPTGRDGTLIAETLSRHGIHSEICSDIEQICNEVNRGAGAAILAEEALTVTGLATLSRALGRQPPWSDIPIIVSTVEGETTDARVRAVASLGTSMSLAILERPVRILTMVVTVRAALGARRRQYSMRDLIRERERVEREQRLLAQASARLISSHGYRDTLNGIATFLVPLLADLCVIDEVEPNGHVHKREVVFADQTKQRAWADVARQFTPRPGWQTPQARVLESGTAVLVVDVPEAGVESIAHDEEHAQFMRAVDFRSMMVLPLLARGKTLGALTFVMAESDRRYSSSDLGLAQEIARLVAFAIDNGQLYEAAQRATRAREDLLAIVSHDLKNPLGVILMSTAVMTRPSGGDDRTKSRELIDAITRNAERMNRLIQDLLDTASIEAGKLSIERRRLSVATLVADTLEAMQPLAASKSLHLKNEVPTNLPPIFADSNRVQQVFANLLGNAIKFTPADGTITLRAEEIERGVQFSVADTGSGIPEEDLPHLFERFWQGRRTARQGTGLGLSIVKGIVAAHGGRIWVESGIGTGSTFFFTFPVALHDAAEPAEDERAEEANGVEVLQVEIEKHAMELEDLQAEVRKREFHTALESTRVARELAERASQFRRDFMELVSHELRGPLTGIELLIERMRRDRESPPTPRQEKIIRRMFASVARLTALIQSLLQHALIESGRLTTQMSTFDVREIAAEVIAELRAYAEEKGLELKFAVASDVVLIKSDPELTRLILLNLVGNAIKFTERGGVEISLDCTTEGCRFAVRDSGPGIPAEERVRVFEPFAKAGNLTQSYVAGIGLGLALVREVASALGGHVELESEMGRGSVFTVTLPSMPQESQGEHAPLH